MYIGKFTHSFHQLFTLFRERSRKEREKESVIGLKSSSSRESSNSSSVCERERELKRDLDVAQLDGPVVFSSKKQNVTLRAQKTVSPCRGVSKVERFCVCAYTRAWLRGRPKADSALEPPGAGPWVVPLRGSPRCAAVCAADSLRSFLRGERRARRHAPRADVTVCGLSFFRKKRRCNKTPERGFISI